MSKDKNLIAIILAILAAALYAISTPVSKMMLHHYSLHPDGCRLLDSGEVNYRDEDINKKHHNLCMK